MHKSKDIDSPIDPLERYEEKKYSFLKVLPLVIYYGNSVKLC